MTGRGREAGRPVRMLVRILIGVALVVAVIWLLFTVAFPWVDARLLDDPTLAGLR